MTAVGATRRGVVELSCLSPHFTLAEMSVTRTGHSNVPPGPVVEHLIRLCEEILEPIRAEWGPVKVYSGYRSETVNSAVGGAPNSAHRTGDAADFDTGRDLVGVYLFIMRSALPIGQVILYPSRDFIHVSHREGTGFTCPFSRRALLSPSKGVYVPAAEGWRAVFGVGFPR